MPDPVYYAVQFNPKTAHKDLKIFNGGLSVVAKNSNSKTVFLGATWKKGVHSFSVKLSKIKNGQYIEVGVATSAHLNKNFVGSDQYSWGFGSDGQKYHNGNNTAYGQKYGKGDIVKCTVNFSAKTISFAVNGKDVGVAYSQVTGVFIPCVSIHYQDDEVTIVR